MPSPPRGRRLVAALVLVAAAILFVEGSSLLLWRWATGGWFSPRAAAERRAAAGARGPEGRPVTPAADPLAFMRHEVVQPFLGYVVNPVTAGGDAQWPHLRVTPRGFFATPEDLLPLPEGSRPLRVGIFGGSVAFVFSFAGRPPLVEAVRAAGREPVFVSRALGGYKQPQQLMALAYDLSLGERFDVVINLDGFNDLVLPLADNALQRVYPFYPRNWQLRITDPPDPGIRERIGERALRVRRRAERAELFSRPPLAWSPTASLLWLALDRAAAGRIAKLDAELAEATVGGRRRYATHGPGYRWRPRQGVLRDAAQVWARASRAMHELAAGHGIRYYHFLQPNQYVPGSKPLSAEERRTAYDEEHPYGNFVRRGWDHLRREGEALRREEVAFHDLTEVFADVEETVYSDDCCHLNERGNLIVGRAIAEVIARDLPAASAPATSP